MQKAAAAATQFTTIS